jgi:hypothetical protein
MFRSQLWKRIFIAYLIFLFTFWLIWRYHEKSIRLEEAEEGFALLKYSPKRNRVNLPVKIDRIQHWLSSHPKLSFVNLSSILSPKRHGKYFVYLCHETCGGLSIIFDFLPNLSKSYFLLRLGRSTPWNNEYFHDVIDA